MIITREQVLKLGNIIKKIKEKNCSCHINVKYKVLKIEQIIKEEFEIASVLLDDIGLKYAELNEELQPKTKDGGLVIKKDKILDLQQEVKDFQKMEIQLPDFYFTIDELEELNLSFKELESFVPLIKI